VHKPTLSALPRTPSHRLLLIAAMRSLILSKGFPATTVDEVCERAGVTKGSFYHHFQSKEDLGVAALRNYYEDVLAAFTGGCWTQVEDPWLRLREFVHQGADVLTGPVMANGCMLGAMSLDLAESSPDVRALLSTMFAELRDVVGGLIEDAAKHRGVQIDAGRLGDQFLAVIEGSIILAKAHDDQSVRRHGMELFGQHLEFLLGSAATG
jgi:TetR/AcrR family transcriptional repressor of nem operon